MPFNWPLVDGFSVCVDKVRETESGKTSVFFAVVVDLQDSVTSSSSSSSSSESRSTCEQHLAWVVARHLQDFLDLRQQLLAVANVRTVFLPRKYLSLPQGGVHPPKTFFTPPTPTITAGVTSSFTYPNNVFAILIYRRLLQ